MQNTITLGDIPLKMIQAFNKAVSLSENLQLDGSVNWNYVDADVYMDVGPRDSDGNPISNQEHYIMFDMLCQAYEDANGKQVQNSDICEDASSIGI